MSRFNVICNTSHVTTSLETEVTFNQDDNHVCDLANDFLENSPKEAFDEWILEVWPFCDFEGVGMSESAYLADPNPSFASKLSPNCRNITIGWLVILAVLATVITMANCLVITGWVSISLRKTTVTEFWMKPTKVLSRDSFYHNTYGVYKFSLAIADLLVGAVVLPFLLAYKTRGYFFIKMPFRKIGEIPRSIDATDQSVLNLCGICTVFSVAVSIYTLTASRQLWNHSTKLKPLV